MSLAIGLMLIGGLLGLAGAFTTVLLRLDGLSWTDVIWAGSRAAAHPEQYVRSEHVKTVRCLNLVAVSIFLVGALLTVGHALLKIL
jgi:hypothetical protein